MNPPPPITSAERWLCLALALLWSGAAAWVFTGPDDSDWLLTACTEWVFEQWRVLRTASLPELSLDSVLTAAVTSALLGVLPLTSQYLAELIGRGRWLRLRALWFWTGLHALLSTVYPIWVVASWLPHLSDFEIRPVRFSVLAVCTVALAVLLSIAFASYRLWRMRRRMENVEAE